ncbi:MarR family transcriptional regulator [uncultured Serinicoccus sp.]|uniref:MarR family winged helix-turn-helix transcriptional regulator n=1 Tax=uncultured Serinicoccus sp. TaxID=735514 RepID=UPI002621F582|nr:MarR family transcriptional regulator [uncultured Serinicoccus sp.]
MSVDEHDAGRAEGAEEAIEEVGRLTRSLLREGVALAARLELEGMHATDRRALGLLDRLGAAGAASPSALADGLDLTRAAATAVVDRLVAAGLVARRRSASDGRRVELTLTARARALGTEHLRPWNERITRAGSALTPSEAAVVRRYLAAVLDPDPESDA